MTGKVSVNQSSQQLKLSRDQLIHSLPVLLLPLQGSRRKWVHVEVGSGFEPTLGWECEYQNGIMTAAITFVLNARAHGISALPVEVTKACCRGPHLLRANKAPEA